MHAGITITALVARVDGVLHFDRETDIQQQLDLIDSLYANIQDAMRQPQSRGDFLQLASMEFYLLNEARGLREGRRA